MEHLDNALQNEKKQGVYYILWLPKQQYWYVGQSTDIDKRLKQHIKSKKNDWHEYFRTHLDEFEYKEIELVDDVNDLRDREDYYIGLLKPKHTSKKANKGSYVGHKTDEQKQAQREKMLGKNTGPRTDEEKSNISKYTKIAMNTPEMKAKLSANAKEVMSRPEVRAKLSAAHKGKKLSEESRAKQSASLKLTLSRPEIKAKQIAGIRLAQSKPEYRARLSASLKGHPVSDETKAKISAAKKGKPSNATGTTWMHKPNSNEKPQRVKKCDIENKKKEGYILGMY